MIAIVGVVVLAGAGVAIAVLSVTVARHPDRAALLMVLSAAGGAMALFGFSILTMFGAGMAGAPGTSHVLGPSVSHPAERVVTWLVVAAILAAVAAWLIRTGDWERPEE